MDQKAEILKQTVIEEEKKGITLAEKLAEKKKVQRKKNIKRISILLVVSFFGYGLWFLLKPYQASAEYGICRTLLELVIPYPESLYVSEVTDLSENRGLRIWYTHTDAFGEFRMERFICQLGVDPMTGRLKIGSLSLGKVNMPQEQVDYLSNALVLFEENPLILNYPSKLPDSLGALHFDFDMFRRVQISDRKY